MNDETLSRERADLLESLATHRFFLRNTCRDLDDEQAARRTTVSELCLGGLVKHVTLMERNWRGFIERGASAMPDWQEPSTMEQFTNSFRMLDGETLTGLLAAYDAEASRTDELIRALPDLDAAHLLPEAPWFPPGASWSARRVLLHLIGETTQHAGHADIIREALDGAKSMG
ncbi:DinB family protein [Pilimelia columellifera]|uniref:DinB family protein n=1 Tax=Pilimelia columellifera subsp. columellifera TaxID=706583 RepID=A0ABN3N4K4_9ACTN